MATIKDEMIQDITNAFETVTYPDIEDVFIYSGNHIFDTKIAATQLSFLNLSDLDISILNRNRDRMSYLTPEGFLAYMPVFLIAIILYPYEVDVMKDNLVYCLMPNDKEQFQISLEKRTSLFGASHIKVIIRFFENYEIFFPRSKWLFTERDEIEIYKAIVYWGKILKSKS